VRFARARAAGSRLLKGHGVTKRYQNGETSRNAFTPNKKEALRPRGRVKGARPVMARFSRDPFLLDGESGGAPVICRTCLVAEKIFVPGKRDWRIRRFQRGVESRGSREFFRAEQSFGPSRPFSCPQIRTRDSLMALDTKDTRRGRVLVLPRAVKFPSYANRRKSHSRISVRRVTRATEGQWILVD